MRKPYRLSAATAALYALAVSAALGFSTTPGSAQDDNQGNRGNGIGATATNHNNDGDQNHGAVVSAAARGHGHHRARPAIAGTSDGTTLGTWTSSDVPAGARLTMNAAAIAAAAVAVATSYTFIAQPGDGLRMQHIVSSGPNAVVADLTGVCRVRPAQTEE